LIYGRGQAEVSLESSPAWVNGTLIVFTWLALVTTLYSGAEYVLAAARFVKGSAAELR
jgi:hypothetical protein